MATEIDINCNIITPMFCYGVDKKLELRAESIRGAMRYWWRALHPNLVNDENLDFSKLFEEESKIFGSQDIRSSIEIVSIYFNNNGENEPKIEKTMTFLPHKQKGKWDSLSGNFYIKFKIRNEAISVEQLANLLYITGALGGIGKRTRRGFGRFLVEGCTVTEDSIINAIKKVVNSDWSACSQHKGYPYLQAVKFSESVTEDSIINAIKKVVNSDWSACSQHKGYPYLQAVKFSESVYNDFETPLKVIGNASHNNFMNTNSALGYARVGRLASTICAGVVPHENSKYKIIAVSLGHSLKDLTTSKVNSFINTITA